MNRDELRSRFEEGRLATQESRQAKYCYPVDTDSKGTWFGVNNNGVTLSLLNGYQGASQNNRLSRGGIIPAALKLGHEGLIESHLQTFDYALYNPFDLFMISKNCKIHFKWDGQQYSYNSFEAKPWFMFTSSSFKAEEVQTYRHAIFKRWSKKINNRLKNPEQILTEFHLQQESGKESYAVLMEREKSHTKSIVQACLTEKNLILKYKPNIFFSTAEKTIVKNMVLAY